MTDRWVGVVALSLLVTGCAGFVGIDDWTPQGLAPDASGPVSSSASAASSGPGAAGGGGSSSDGGAGGGGTGAGGAAGSGGGASASSSVSGTGGAGGSAGPCDGKPDGASCGPKESERCCGEICVDISSDEGHCGGCDTPCAGGQTCEPIDQASCGSSPADTSGRCTCTTNAQCPLSQLCDVTRCSPDGTPNCDGVFVDVPSCANYCAY